MESCCETEIEDARGIEPMTEIENPRGNHEIVSRSHGMELVLEVPCDDGEPRRVDAGETVALSSFTHGTRYGYRVRGCRCGECLGWRAANARAEYRRNPDAQKARNAKYRAKRARDSFSDSAGD